MLSRLALYAPRTLISFHASRAFLSRCSTTGFRNCDIRYWKRKRERGGEKKREEKNSIELQNLLHDSASKRLKNFF